MLLALGLSAIGPVSAQDWGGAIGIASDNVERGYSLTGGNPAWLADLHVGIGTAWVAGIGLSATRPPGESNATRAALYADRRWRINEDWSAKVGIAHYESFPARGDVYESYNELNSMIGYRGKWRFSLAVSPDLSSYAYWHIRRGLSAWTEANLHQPLAGRLSLDAGVGYAYFRERAAQNYAYGSLGLSYGTGDAYFYLSRVWRQEMTWTLDAGGEWYDFSLPARSSWVGAIVWSF